MTHTPSRAVERARARPHRLAPVPHRWRRAVLGLAIATGLTAVVGPQIGASSAADGGETLFRSSSTHAVKAVHTTRPTELGMRFKVTTPGTITGIRYFSSPASRGTHIGSLWAGHRSRLAKVSLPASSTSRWRSASFSRGVHVDPGHRYVVSYYAPHGRYAVQRHGFSARVSSGHIRASKAAGVYRRGKGGGFPHQRAGRSNFLVDVIFVPDHGSPRGLLPIQHPKVTPPTPSITWPSAPPTRSHPTTGSVPSVTDSSAPGTFPTRTSAGLPSGWTPSRTITGDVWLRHAGAVLQDVRVVNGTIHVAAPNVTLRRVQGQGAFVQNYNGGTCNNGMVVEDSTFTAAAHTSDRDPQMVGMGGYTLRNSVIDGVPEGARVGASDVGCGAVTIDHSYIRIVPPTTCSDWHGDGVQGYGGDKLTVRNSAFILDIAGSRCGGGTAPLFYPSKQGNAAIDIDGLIVSGGGYPFRDGMPGPVKHLYVVDKSWVYGPVNVNCSAVTAWQANVATLDAAGQPVAGRAVACSGSGT